MKHFFSLALLFSFCTIKAQLPNNVPVNGLVGYWPFTGNANDVSGNGNHGTSNNSTLTFDRFGNSNCAYYCNNTYIQATSLPLALTDDYSFCYWQKLVTKNNTKVMVELNENKNCNHNPHLLQLNNHAYLGTCITTSNNKDLGILDSMINKWTFIAWTHSNGKTKIYKNAKLIDSLIYNWPSSTVVDMTLANDNNVSNTFPSNTNIDDVGFWDRVLTQWEINNLYYGIDDSPNSISEFSKNGILLSFGLNSIRVYYSINDNLLNKNYKLIDLCGNIAYSNKFDKSQGFLEIENLASGMYILLCEGHALKIIKN
jgi:hypothetical protein